MTVNEQAAARLAELNRMERIAAGHPFGLKPSFWRRLNQLRGLHRKGRLS